MPEVREVRVHEDVKIRTRQPVHYARGFYWDTATKRERAVIWCDEKGKVRVTKDPTRVTCKNCKAASTF